MKEREQHLNYIAFFGCNSIYETIIAAVVVIEEKLKVKSMVVE